MRLLFFPSSEISSFAVRCTLGGLKLDVLFTRYLNGLMAFDLDFYTHKTVLQTMIFINK